MANHEIPVLLSELKNQFSTDMRKIETSDLVHADTVNPLFRQLLINDAYANAQMKDLAAGTTENDALQTEEKQMVNAVNEINRKLGDLTETVEEKVKKIEGKGLSSNDFTDEEKQKLSNLPDQSELDTTLEQKINKTDIVNDLVTGGVERVLSAEQGKVLFQSVVDGKGKIATAINDLAGSNVANQNMTFGDIVNILKTKLKNKKFGIRAKNKHAEHSQYGGSINVTLTFNAETTDIKNLMTGTTYTFEPGFYYIYHYASNNLHNQPGFTEKVVVCGWSDYYHSALILVLDSFTFSTYPSTIYIEL